MERKKTDNLTGNFVILKMAFDEFINIKEPSN